MTVAILCSGQGGQHREMFRLVGANPAAEPIFKSAATHLDGIDPRRFVEAASEHDLFENRAGQILCCTQALAAWAILDVRPATRLVLAGYSVGELAAWGCAGIFTPDTTLRLAAERARAMDASAPPGSGLAVIVGLRRDALDRLLARHAVSVAIVNGPDSVVVGGEAGPLDACLAEAAGSGARKAGRLKVLVPSHTALLQAATRCFAHTLERTDRRPLATGIRLLSGIDGESVRDLADGAGKLAAQISRTLDWAASLRACAEAGAVRFLELGPGAALSRMAAALPERPAARSIEDFRTGDGVRDWLARG